MRDNAFGRVCKWGMVGWTALSLWRWFDADAKFTASNLAQEAAKMPPSMENLAQAIVKDPQGVSEAGQVIVALTIGGAWLAGAIALMALYFFFGKTASPVGAKPLK